MAIVHALGWIFPDADALRDALAPVSEMERYMITPWLNRQDAPRFLKFRCNNAHNKDAYVLRNPQEEHLVISTVAGPRSLGNLAYADALGLGYRLFRDSVDFRPSHILLDTTTFSFIHTPAGELPPENIEELLEGVETTVFLLNSPRMSKEERKMIGISEKAKLIVVKLDPSLPWCVVDPQRWAAEGAHGETAMLTITSYKTDETKTTFVNYVLVGCPVTVTAYNETYKDSSHPTVMKFDDALTLTVGCRPLEGRPRQLFDKHPELRVKVRWNGKRASIPAHTAAYAAVNQGRKLVKKKDYPFVLVPKFSTKETEGLVLVEPVTMLHQAIGIKEHDLACHTSGLS